MKYEVNDNRTFKQKYQYSTDDIMNVDAGDITNSSIDRYTCNLQNQLVGYQNGSTNASYTYNVNGFRKSKAVNGNTTGFVWNGSNLVAETNGENIVNTYNYGIDGILMCDMNGNKSYYLKNAHGDVVSTTGTDGNITNQYKFDAFGKPLSTQIDSTNPFGYCGEYYDKETSSYYLRARYYDPATSRMLSEDTHWNIDNMIYGDNQKAVQYPTIGDTKVYYDKNERVVKTENYQPNIFEQMSEQPQDVVPQIFDIQRTTDINAILQSSNLYIYAMNNPLKYVDPSGNSATIAWGGSTWWLTGVD